MTNKTILYNTGKAVTRKELINLIESAEDSGDWSKVKQANVSKIKDMSYLLDGVEGIKDLNLDGWDTSNVTDMGYMFSNSVYDHPLRFNTSNVNDMESMFLNSKYNHPLHFDTSNVEGMSYMFYGSKYDHPLHFDTSNVTDMRYMFYNSVYNHPLHFNTSNVRNMRFMFARSRYNHPLALDTSSVKSIDGIFDNASITQLITFKGGNIPDDIQEFINENNITYEERYKIDSVIHNKCDTNETVIVSSFKL